jgi:hypothetical protein
MKMKARGYRLRIDDTPGLPVMFTFGVKPVCAIVIPVVEFATALTNDEIRNMTSVMTKI